MEHAGAGVRWARWPAFVLVALIGLAVRLPRLASRPMHTDEAVNAYIVGQLLAGERFNYDPQDRHGPALAEIAFPLVRIQGARSFSDLTESKLRLTPVVAGTVTVLLFGAAAEMFGFLPSLLAALLFALAPLSVYYDRYFIHESLLCAATFGLILAGGHAAKLRSVSYAVLAAACAAFMLACKETAILHYFAFAAAGLLFNLRELRSITRSLRPGPLLAATITFIVLLTILFTLPSRHTKALPTLLQMGPDILARAGGQGHEKPWWYYAQLLTGGWSGGLLFALACLGLFWTLNKRDAGPYRFLAYYGLLIAAIYSLIPYKTPWLALNLWLPLALFAARAIDLFRHWTAKHLSWRASLSAFLMLVACMGALIAHDTWQRVFLLPADESNPYVYAHTSDDILALPTEIADLARQKRLDKPRIAVIAADPWPLPWYLRSFTNVGFWQPGQQVANADFFVTSTEAAEQYAGQLKDFRPEFFGVRPGVLILLWSREPK